MIGVGRFCSELQDPTLSLSMPFSPCENGVRIASLISGQRCELHSSISITSAKAAHIMAWGISYKFLMAKQHCSHSREHRYRSRKEQLLFSSNQHLCARGSLGDTLHLDSKVLDPHNRTNIPIVWLPRLLPVPCQWCAMPHKISPTRGSCQPDSSHPSPMITHLE